MLQRLGQTKHPAEDDGFTVAEVVVALALFMVLAASLALSLIAVLDTSRSNESRVIAANLVAKKIETLRGTNVTTIALGQQPTETVLVEGKKYYLTVRSALNTTGGVGSACDGSTGAAAFKQIHVEATWDRMSGVEPVRSDTTRSLPIAGLTGTTGVVTIPVKDAQGKAVSGQQVTLTSTGGSWVATTQYDGCAVFNNLPAGTDYQARVNTASWVDRTQAQVSVQAPIQVLANNVTKDPGFVYDRAATVIANLTRPAGADTSFAIPANLGVTLNNSFSAAKSYQVCGSAPCASAAGTSRQVAGIFPFSGGYTTWAGTCPSAKPAMLAPIVAAPGQTGSGQAMLAGLRILVKDSLGVVQNGWSLQAVNTDAACSEKFLLGSSGATPIAVALPQGRWSIVATSGAVSRMVTVDLVSGQVVNSGQPIVVTV